MLDKVPAGFNKNPVTPVLNSSLLTRCNSKGERGGSSEQSLVCFLLCCANEQLAVMDIRATVQSLFIPIPEFLGSHVCNLGMTHP